MVRFCLYALHANIIKDIADSHAARIFAVGGFIGIICKVQIAEIRCLAVLHAAEP